MTEGRMLAGYALKERIAVGGMAEIYRAVRSGPGAFAKSVAIKMVLPDLCRDAQFVEMFMEEARLMAQLSSSHLVHVFDFGQEGETYYLVMEYVDGLDLAALLSAERALPLGLAVYVARQICSALSYLHTARDGDGLPLDVVHRDVTPGNVLLSGAGDVKLGDFGIAKARARSVRTERGVIKGKLAYLSPEQARGEELDNRSDIYGVGLLLFEALTGERYLQGEDAGLLRAATDPCWRPPSSLAPHIPRALDLVVQRALAADPASRYADAPQLDKALGTLVSEDSGELRQRLAARVLHACGGIEEEATPSKPKQALPTRKADRERSPAVGKGEGRRTEVLQGTDRTPRSRPLLLIVGVAILALGALAFALLGMGPEGKKERPTAPLAQSAPRSPRPGGDAAAPATAMERAPLPDASPSPQPDAMRAPRRRTRRRASTQPPLAVEPQTKPSTKPQTKPALKPEMPASHGPTDQRVRRGLALVDALLEKKGILRADAPSVYAGRERLGAAGAATSAKEVATLVSRVKKIRIDRTFVAAKIARLNRKLRTAKLSPDVAARWTRGSRQALSHVVRGRYAEANRELNAIARLLGS